MLAVTLLLAPTLSSGAGESAGLQLQLTREIQPTRIEVNTDRAVLSRDDESVFTGDVEVRYGERRIMADEVRYNPETGRLDASGNVSYADPRIELSGSRGEFATDDATGNFFTAEFRLPAQDGRGRAGRIWTRDDNVVEMRDVNYTTCPVGDDDWVLVAPEVTLDRERGIGVGRNVQLRFMDVPILYAPWLSFPVSEKRKTGMLVPDIGRSDRSGTDFGVPIYWNMAPNYDAVITPRLLSKRGVQINTDFRYLWPRTRGELAIRYLPNDKTKDETRSRVELDHATVFDNGWRFDGHLQHVSDDEYFEDLGRSLGAASPTYLERRADLRYRGRNWRMLARAQGFQTLAQNITEENRPYERVPQLLGSGSWRTWGNTNLSLRGELVNFQRRSGVTGLRLDLRPGLSWPITGPGYSIIPAVELRHTHYELDDIDENTDDSPSLTAPEISLESTAVFERPIGANGQLTQTLEPRVQFTHIPFRDQSGLPVFDSGEPDFNFVQLFRENRFTGGDRLGDTDKLSIGLTSRLIDFADGQELLTATLGQAIFLSERGVALPDGNRPTADASSLIGEVGMQFSRRWNADIGYQWDPERESASKTEVRVQFRPQQDRVLNLAYRFRRDELEQSDLSFAWPLAERWNVVGRWNYSIQDETTLERFAGVEYETCCWVARVVSRNFVNNLNGERDTALFTQLHFKGLASVGGRADLFLENGILGYSAN
ncbi:MAG: LPS assembly protein LptD [Gammaproteobacteria bacterium]|nr:LPS assembly protein LptD [Gammaproteobacteria bacterium]